MNSSFGRLMLVVLSFSLTAQARAEPPSAAEIERLIQQLGAPTYATRETAARALTAIGEPAFRALLKASHTSAIPEVRTRAKGLCKAIIDGLERLRFDGHAGQINQIAFSTDGRYALSGGLDTTMRLWDVAKHKEIRRFEGHTGGVWGVALSPEGDRALSGGGALLRGNSWAWDLDPSVRLWDVKTGKELRQFPGHKGQVLSVAFAPDGRHAVSAGTDQALRLWQLGTGQLQRLFEGHQSYVFSVTFSPNGRQLLSASRDGTVRLWNVDSGKEIRRFMGHQGWVMAAVFSPGGDKVLSAGADHTVRLWEAQTGKELAQLRGHTTMVLRVAFAVDGEHVVSGGGCRMLNPNQYVPAGDDYGVRLWHLASGKEICCLEDHTGPIMGLAFAPDGRRALSGSADATLRLWKLPR